MGKPLIVLVDPDISYLAPLECAFLERFGDKVSLEVITDDSYYDEFLTMPHDIEAMLVAESNYSDHHKDLDRQNIGRLFVLTEESSRDTTGNLHVDYTFKYSNLNLIMEKVTSACPGLRMNDSADKTSQVVLCYSPVGGAGKTTVALALSTCLQSLYQRVLFVDAEHVQTFGCFLQNPKYAPSSMANDMAQEGTNFFDVLADRFESYGFDYLPPLRASIASYGIPFDFFVRFVQAARDSGRYDFIVVDTDSVFNDEKIPLFSLADRIVVPVTQDVRSLYKTMRFLDSLDSTVEEKYLFVCNKFDQNEKNAFVDTGKGSEIVLDGYIERDKALADMDALLLGDVPSFQSLAHSLY